MKTLRKVDIEAMERELQVLDDAFMASVVGGMDCWWRCIAYIKSCGTSYTADDAMALAQEYYCTKGWEFDENDYAFSGTVKDHGDYISEYVVSSSGEYCAGTILSLSYDVIEPGYTGNRPNHTVIMTGGDDDNIYYFDPQTGLSGSLDKEAVLSSTGSCVYNIK